MPRMSKGTEQAYDDRIRLLRCAKCGHTEIASIKALLDYMRSRWPKCCGETMALFIEEKLPPSFRF